MENILSVDQIDNQQLRPFGYIYITTNLINNKKYIGMHKSSTFNPNYKGSGKILWRAISKYGWNNFKVEILKWCFSKEELIDQEKYFIESYHACESRGFYNCMEGGHGGNNKTYLSEEEYTTVNFGISESDLNLTISVPMGITVDYVSVDNESPVLNLLEKESLLILG